jgi:hypothetical protein
MKKLLLILIIWIWILLSVMPVFAVENVILGNLDNTFVPPSISDGRYVYVVSEGSGVRFVKSSDYGETWDPVKTIDGTISTTAGDIQAQAMDELTVYTAYVGNNYKPIRFAKTINGGASWDIYEVSPDTGNTGLFVAMHAFSKNIVYVTYYSGAAPLNYWISVSTDGGVNWTVHQIDTQGPGTTSYSSVFATAADTVHVCYFKSDVLLYQYDLYYAKSTDSGATWTITPLDTAGTVGQWCSIKAFAGNLYISYIDITNGDTKFIFSPDNGASWNAPILVDATGGTGRTSLATFDGLQVMIAYPVSTTIDFAKSIDAGSSWPTIVQVATGLSSNLPASLHAASNSLLYITGGSNNFFKSINGGTTWTPKATGIGASSALAVTAW